MLGLVLASLTTAAAAPVRAPREPAPTPPPAKPVYRLGDTVFKVNDALNQNDGIYQGRRHKVYTIDLEAGKTYQIDMCSGNFDSYLFFENPGGRLLAQDDDSGGYPDARIIYRATETGKFRIIASHFGNGGVFGQFTVRVRLTDGIPLEKVDAGKQ
jgi:hypothetical protein